MEYLHRKELESDPVIESTAVTMKTIKELLAEEEARLEQAARDEAEKRAKRQATPESAPQSAPKAEAESEVPTQPVLQIPPEVPMAPQPEALPPETEADDARPSLISRLFGRG